MAAITLSGIIYDMKTKARDGDVAECRVFVICYHPWINRKSIGHVVDKVEHCK